MAKRRRKIKYLSESAIEYMGQIWGFNDSSDPDDMAMFWDLAEFELVALRLVNAGAVDPNCSQAKEMLQVAHSITPEYERRVIRECLKEYVTYECRHCNYVHYAPSSWGIEYYETNCFNCHESKKYDLRDLIQNAIAKKGA